MKQIVIGDKPLMQISEEDIFQVAVRYKQVREIYDKLHNK